MDTEHFFQLESDLCRVLTHPVRLHLLEKLREGEKSVGELAAGSRTTNANISSHLAVLYKAGAVTKRREGQKIYYAAAYPQIFQAFDIMRGVLMEVLSRQGSIYKEMKSAFRK